MDQGYPVDNDNLINFKNIPKVTVYRGGATVKNGRYPKFG